MKLFSGEPSETLCSGNGNCECNKCVCDSVGSGDGKYFGKYCQDCAVCTSIM